MDEQIQQNEQMPEEAENNPAGGVKSGNKTLVLIILVVVLVLVVVFMYNMIGRQPIPVSQDTVTDGQTTKISPNNDTTAAIEQELNAVDLGDIDVDFEVIDSDINQL